MTILAIDTATELLSVAVCDTNTGQRNRYCADDGLQHGSRLLSIVGWMLKTAETPAARIDAIVCCDGPGSFTGLRIGLSTAKGLSAALDVPVHAVPTLDAFASSRRVWPGLIVVAIDARKNRFYAALFRGGTKLTPDLDVNAERLATLVAETARPDEPVLLSGPAASQLSHRFEEDARMNRDSASLPLEWADRRYSLDPDHRDGAASGLIDLVSERPDAYRAGDDHGPHYVRSTDAEMGITVAKVRPVPPLL